MGMRSALTAAAVVGVLLLGGCAGPTAGTQSGGAGAASPTPSPSTSNGYVLDAQGRPLQPERSWPTPTPGPDVTDASARGADSFGRYFVEVVQLARSTGVTDVLSKASDPACTYCANLARMIRDDYAAGHWLDGMEYTVTGTEGPVPFPDDAATFAVVYTIQSSAIAYFNGRTVAPVPKKDERLELHVCRKNDTWLICEAIGGAGDEA